MINYIKDAVSAVSGIKTFLFNTDYRNNFDLQNVEFPCCVLTPIMRTNYDLNNIIRESAELQLSVVDLAPYEYTGDDLYAINKRCSDLALQVIANLRVKSKLDKELTFEFILPSGDELISGVMCNLQVTMKQGSCIGAPSYVEVIVQPIKKESITSNGKHIISPSSGFNAMKEVEVDVDVEPTLEEKQVTITENGTTTITPSADADGLSKVEVEVVVPMIALASLERTILENGEFEFLPNDGEAFDKVKIKINVTMDVIDNLLSNRIDASLSANQGRILNEIKANIDGYYPKLSAGTADLLSGHERITPSEFVFRPSAGNLKSIKDGNAFIKRLKGNSLLFNQLITDGKELRDVPFSGGTMVTSYSLKRTPLPNKHKYLWLFDVFSPNWSSVLRECVHIFINGNIGFPRFYDLKPNVWQRCAQVASPSVESNEDIIRANVYKIKDGLTDGNIQYKNFQLFDLTAMFGEGNEPTAEEFQAMFPNEYYEPCEKIIDFKGNAIKTIGFNQLNLEGRTEGVTSGNGTIATLRPELLDTSKYFLGITTNNVYGRSASTINKISYNSLSITCKAHGYGVGFPVEVSPNANYQISVASIENNGLISAVFYDEKGGYISYLGATATTSTITSPPNAKIMLVLFFRADINQETEILQPCVHYVHSGNRNGEYEEYEEFVRELPDIELKSTHNVFDELTAEKHIQRVGVRAYQEGDENDATLLTDKATTYYPLDEEIVTEFAENEMPNLNYKVWDYGTEQIIPRGELTSPIKADIVYTPNIVDQADNNLAEIKNLQQQIASLQQQLTALASNG